MKNPFVQMAILAAAMAAAFQENRARDNGIFPKGHGHGARGEPGKRNPAGSKLVRKFYRNHHGYKASYKVANEWYRGLK